MKIRVQEYIRDDGSDPYKRWFDALDARAAAKAKVATATLRVELGNTSNVRWFHGIGELKIDWCPGYRVYLAKDGETLIVLFGGGTKRRQPADIVRPPMKQRSSFTDMEIHYTGETQRRKGSGGSDLVGQKKEKKMQSGWLARGERGSVFGRGGEQE